MKGTVSLGCMTAGGCKASLTPPGELDRPTPSPTAVDERPPRLSRRTLIARGPGLIGLFLGLRAFQTAAQSEAPKAIYNERAREAVARGLAYLARRQTEDGAFGAGTYQRNVAVCSLCGMAFLANGQLPGRGPYGRHVERCVEFVLSCSQESGFIHFAEAASRGPMYGHGFATLFLAETYGTTDDENVRDPLARAVRLIVTTQNDEGGWRYQPRREDADVSVTVCQVMALRAARNAGIYVPNETIDRAVDYVKRCQNPDGGFMYQANVPGESAFARSAAAVVALYSAGIYEGEELEKGLAYLMKYPPRKNIVGKQNYYFYGHYYAVQAMWQAGGRYWNTWYPSIRDILLQQQQPDGAWFDTISPEYGTAMALLILQMPSNYLPIFRR